MFDSVISFIRSIYGEGFIPLHEPRFRGKEKEYLAACIDSGFVSSVGEFVNALEKEAATYTGAQYAVACVNGTAAIHVGLHALGVSHGDEVLTQAFTFVATGNAISYTGAKPIFVDIDPETLGMSPKSLRAFLSSNAILENGKCLNKASRKQIKACVPMHTFGMPCAIEEIVEICNEWGIPVLEDAAESLGSFIGNQHTGTFGKIGTISFNGNKIITSGGGGILITDDEATAKLLKHLTTTAKVPHAWEYVHDMTGFNYRMPNLNAALLLAQLEMLPTFLAEKRELAEKYMKFFADHEATFIQEPSGTTANYWLNALLFGSKEKRDAFLKATNESGVMTRPPWHPLNELEMFKDCQITDLQYTRDLSERIVNIPSSAKA